MDSCLPGGVAGVADVAGQGTPKANRDNTR